MALIKNINYKLNLYETDIDYNFLEKIMSDTQISEINRIKNSINQNVLIENCYCRIDELKGNKDILEFRLCIYNKVQTQLIESKVYSFIPSVADNSQNFIKQGYE